MAGVPNTLPLQDLNRDAELGRVGCSLCPGAGKCYVPRPRHKTSFYNMLEGSGQTNRGCGWKNLSYLPNTPTALST